MISFYHASIQSKSSGFIRLFIMLLVLILGFYLIRGKVNLLHIFGDIISKKEYRDVDIGNLYGFSNFYHDKKVCTQGLHVKEISFDVLKTDLTGDQFTRSAWVKYINEKAKIFDSFIENGQAARVRVCGKFESGRNRGFGDPPIWTKQITIEKYQLLDRPFDIKN